MVETVEWLRGAAAHVDRAQSRHIARFFLHIREHRGNIGGDYLFEQRVSTVFLAYRYHPRDRRRQLDACKPFLPEKVPEVRLRDGPVRLDIQSKIQAQVRNVREGMARIHRLRSKYRKKIVLKVLV